MNDEQGVTYVLRRGCDAAFWNGERFISSLQDALRYKSIGGVISGAQTAQRRGCAPEYPLSIVRITRSWVETTEEVS
jgi:hypothetical protein